MLSLFKKKSQEEKILDQYNQLIKEAYELSKTKRLESDKKIAEAELLLKELDQNLNN